MKTHFEKIVIGIILVSILPIVLHGVQHWLAKRRAAKSNEGARGQRIVRSFSDRVVRGRPTVVLIDC